MKYSSALLLSFIIIILSSIACAENKNSTSPNSKENISEGEVPGGSKQDSKKIATLFEDLILTPNLCEKLGIGTDSYYELAVL